MARSNALGEGRVVLALTAKEADALMVTLEEAEIRPSVGSAMQRVYNALVSATVMAQPHDEGEA